MFGCKRESSEQIRERLLKLCKEEGHESCPPCLDADVALNELADHLLGKDWYVVGPIHAKQVNFEIVKAIEEKYKRVKSNGY